MKPYLMGSEVEYAVSARTPRGVMPSEEVYSLLNEAVRKERLWLPDVNGGRALYLQHAGRFYMDTGGHPELATPEVFTPRQLTCSDKAGERILELARDRVQAERPDLRIAIVKNNIDVCFPDRIAWGCHESHTSWVPMERVGPQLLPHLVSRTIYVGAGCLSARPHAPGFELSQRARHLIQATGSETTGNRAIFCTRVRKATDYARDGWCRAHLISKDSQRAPFGIYLTFGTTGLLFLLMNEGYKVGQGLLLADPVQALQAIACDPWLQVKVPLANGRKLTALQIQVEYLEECERAVARGDFPDWATEVLGYWRQTLEDLDRDPLRLADRLDPYCKLLIFEHELRRAGHTWTDLHAALRTLEGLRSVFPWEVVRAVLAETPSALSAELAPKYGEAVLLAGAQRAGVLERLRFAIRLQTLELHYHELGGLHDQLVAAGRFRSVVVTRDEIEQASFEPPPGGRAAIRGACIRASREPGWMCDWRYLFHPGTGEFVDLRNPFETTRRVVRREQFSSEERSEIELVERFNRLTRR